MTLDATLLERLAEGRPAEGRQVLALPGEGAGWSAVLTTDRADAVGCLVWELLLSRPAPGGGSGLRAWAERVAGRVTGMLESLKVVEVDAGRDEAILRSDGPAVRGEDRHYYEIHLNGTRAASVRRYKGTMTGGKREQVAFALTNEALAKLVVDLTAEN